MRLYRIIRGLAGAVVSRLKFVVLLLRSKTQRKHVVRWLRSTNPDYSLRAAMPWITFDAVDYLSTHLSAGMTVFEYGSGGSTLFLRRFAGRCVSIEHDPAWYARLRSLLRPDDPVDYRLVPAEPPVEMPMPDPADPDGYMSDDADFAKRSFRAYVQQIDTFPDGFFDLVLIDGRARPSCIRHSAPKVRPGGLLILDNADRPYYTARTTGDLRDFTRLRFCGVGSGVFAPWITDIYCRRGRRDVET